MSDRAESHKRDRKPLQMARMDMGHTDRGVGNSRMAKRAELVFYGPERDDGASNHREPEAGRHAGQV
jgi:hypothetical protein